MTSATSIPAAVIGVTGYGGLELIRLLHNHPNFEVTMLCARSEVGRSIAEVVPSLKHTRLGNIEAIDPAMVAKKAQVVFCALPHQASALLVDELLKYKLRVFDLSADFRFEDQAVYEQWYGPHPAAHRLQQSTYGLVEINRQKLKNADLVAVPGCFPTAAILALAPLLDAKLIETNGIVIDAKSGVSGAGRGAKENTRFCETSEGIRAYSVGGKHRHTPEIENILTKVANTQVQVTFVPHLVPMARGILATAYARPKDKNASPETLTKLITEFYSDSPMVEVLPSAVNPDTLWVRGSSYAQVSVTLDPRTKCIIAQAVIDNLDKGAAGQAIQCANLRYGFAEDCGLRQLATLP